MSRIKDKSKAILLRKSGMSYSQIKNVLGISKSTLSGWLYNMPLSEKRIKELGASNAVRIEKYINTMKNKRKIRSELVYRQVSRDIGLINNRELFLNGFFLYWGEGGKVNKSMLSFTNTDPDMVNYFIKWVVTCLGVDKKKLYILLHLYKDMNIRESINFWSKKLNMKVYQFKKPYIKDSKLTDLTYKSGFGKGTCTVRLNNKERMDYVLEGLKYLRSLVIG
jgi:predicted transcriptional regulator